MDHASGMHAGQGLRQRKGQLEKPTGGHSRGRNQRAQSLPLDERHRQKRQPIDLFDRMKGDQIRVFDGGQSLGLPPQPSQAFGMPQPPFGERLERHDPAQPGVRRPVYLPHSALADSFFDAIRPEPSPD